MATEKSKVGPGRPRGQKRTGGRKPGTPNKTNQVTRDFIIREGAPIGLLCKIANGTRIMAAGDDAATKKTWITPTLDQRIHAATILAKKVVPDLKAVEHTGEDGAPMIVQIVRFADASE